MFGSGFFVRIGFTFQTRVCRGTGPFPHCGADSRNPAWICRLRGLVLRRATLYTLPPLNMNKFLLFRSFAATLILVVAPHTHSPAQAPVTLNTSRTFPEITSLTDWRQRADAIKRQAVVSCGLWPMPEKTPLNARVFDRVERIDYSIEKVSIEVHPGVYLAGNLFRPLGKGRGPYPGILNPHGHWDEGRFVNNETGSVFARCIQFARMGMVAFAYDMTGYNDTIQFSPKNADGGLAQARFYDGHVQFAQDPADQLWGISLMGMQTWNNIRALDFLISLEDVDASRVACTGASGGGTQTFMLGAVDDRLAAQVPAVMVSHSMQGGCWCENAPGLRVRFSNMEIAAAAAPRPQFLVAASGDWTRDTMTIEGPAIAGMYQLFGPGYQFGFRLFDFPHNYNRTSREAVYPFMAQHLLNRAPAESLPEQPYAMERPEAMRVFPNNRPPANAVSLPDYKVYLKSSAQASLNKLWPASISELKPFKETMRPVYQTIMQLSPDPQSVTVQVVQNVKHEDGTQMSEFLIRGWSDNHAARVRVFQPRRSDRKVVIMPTPLGMSANVDQAGRLVGLAEALVKARHTVVLYDGFQTGEFADQTAVDQRDPFSNFFTTYNRTDLQEAVGDLVAVTAFARSHLPRQKIILLGRGEAGVWSMLSAPVADAVVADVNRFPAADDQAWIDPKWIVPAIRRMGGLDGALTLAAPNPVFLHHTGEAYPGAPVEQVYQNLNASGNFVRKPEIVEDSVLLNWIQAL